MKNIPEKIYLQIGSKCPPDVDFKELNNVTWSVKRYNDNDIVYYRRAKYNKEICKHTEGCVIRPTNKVCSKRKKCFEV